MFSLKFSFTIFFLWMILRSNQISGETKMDAFYARSKVMNFEFISLDNVITSVTNTQTITIEILYSFLLRRVLKTKRHRLKAPLRTSQVCWSKRGQIYLSPPDFHKDIDITVYIDVESNSGPAQSDNINYRSTNNTNKAKISSNQGNIKIAL
jgi:hypothetical protein